MQLYAITDRKQLATEEALLALVSEWTAGGVDFIQLREKDLGAAQLGALAGQVMARLRGSRSRLLINTAQAALARMAGAEGVHLAGKPTPGSAGLVRQIFPNALISMPCHSLDEVSIAIAERPDMLLFSPIFGKGEFPGQGLEALGQACKAAQGIPVFALGGVTAGLAASCEGAGAAGVAGIRLFTEDGWKVLRRSPAEPGLGNHI